MSGEQQQQREVRWWMAWRDAAKNAEWIRENRGAVTSVHLGHHVFNIEFDGSMSPGKDFSFEEHVKPYRDLNVDVMPCIDVLVSNNTPGEKKSAILQGIVQGDQEVISRLRDTAKELAKLAGDNDFAGYVVDYEPSYEYNVEHVEALVKFIGMLKKELQAFEEVEADVDASGTIDLKSKTQRRVGVCISHWGIIDIRRDQFAEVYATPADDGGADFLMSMAYTYYPPQTGVEGFVELEKRCAKLMQLFGARATIGLGVASNNEHYKNWFSDDTNTVAEFIRSTAENSKAASFSVWGRWYRAEDPERTVDEFVPPLTKFIEASKSGAEAGLVVA